MMKCGTSHMLLANARYYFFPSTSGNYEQLYQTSTNAQSRCRKLLPWRRRDAMIYWTEHMVGSSRSTANFSMIIFLSNKFPLVICTTVKMT